MKKPITYIGRRVTSDDNVLHAFLQDGDDVVLFKRVKFVVIGKAYVATTKGKDGLTLPRIPDEAEEPKVPAKDLKEWQAKDAVADDFERRKRFAKKMARTPEYADLAQHLRPFVENLNFRETRQFVDHLVDLAKKRA